MQVRRDTSGCKPVFDLIEYAMDIDLPDFVISHPIIKALNQGANDLVTVCFPSTTEQALPNCPLQWSNDIFSYNKEQALGDTHNVCYVCFYCCAPTVMILHSR